MGTYASGSGSYGEDAAYYDEVGDDPSLTNGRRGTIFIVDIGPEMFEKDAHGDYYMKKSLIQMRNYLNSIALTANMSDRVRIIFINAPPGAENYVNGCITFYPKSDPDVRGSVMDNVSSDLVQEINEFIDADDIKQEFEKRFGKGKSKIDMGELLHVCAGFFDENKDAQCVVNIYSRNYELEPSHALQDRMTNRLSSLNKKVHTRVFLVDFPIGCKPSKYWDIIDPEYKDRLFSPNPSTTFVESNFRAMARIPFLLGGTAEIPVGVYSLIREKSFIPGVKLDIQTNEVVERTAFYSEVVERTAFCSEVEANGEDQMEVDGEKQEKNGVPMDQRFAIDKDEMYRKTNYGNEDIFLDGFEFESLRRVEPQAIRLIRFDKLSALKDSYRMGPSYYLYPIKNMVANSSELYTALYKACLDQGLYILACITFRSNMPPKMCALVPQAFVPNNAMEKPPYAKYLYEGFHAIPLPYKQDKRGYQELYANPERNLAKDEPVLEPVKKLVERLTADYIPDMFINPKIQGHYRMLECAALNYSIKESKEQLKKCEQGRKPFYEKPGLKSELEKELKDIKDIIAEKYPNTKTLAANQGTKVTNKVSDEAPAKRSRKK